MNIVAVKMTENNDVEHLKTYGDLRKDNQTFISLKEDKKKASQAHNTVNEPFFDEDDDTLVISKCVIPELHLLQGVVNHLFFKGLVPLLISEVAFLWPESLFISSKNYHGRVFEGNACRKLLKSADMLDRKEIYINVGRLSLVPYLNAFKAMDKVVSSCFSTKKVGKDLDNNLKEFEKRYEATQC